MEPKPDAHFLPYARIGERVYRVALLPVLLAPPKPTVVEMTYDEIQATFGPRWPEVPAYLHLVDVQRALLGEGI
jgi:hypothetical protein